MSGPVSWLPELVLLSSCGGDFGKYLELIYEHFTNDFVRTKPAYPGRRWAIKRRPLLDGKPATFWHLISEGEQESARIPDLRRCERIRWPRPMIDALLTGRVCCWRNRRGSSERVLIALEDFSYLVVLEDRAEYIMLWTAYCVEQSHRRRRLKEEYEGYTARSGSWKG